MQTKEARLILGAAIVDDILAIAVLSVVTTMVQTGDTTPAILDITFLVLKILGLFAVLLVGSVVIIPRILHVERLWRSEGSVEGITTAAFFGAAGIAAFVGLSPIVGAFSVGMAVASTRIIKQVEEYVSKLGIIFVPLFFAIIGAQVDLRGVNLDVLYLSGIIIAVASRYKVSWMRITSDDISKREKQSNEGRDRYDIKRRSRIDCSRSRCLLRSFVFRYLYHCNNNGSNNNNNHTSVAKDSIQERRGII